jgi:hypothetical protein
MVLQVATNPGQMLHDGARNNGAEATYFWKSDHSLDTPDLTGFAGLPGGISTPKLRERGRI